MAAAQESPEAPEAPGTSMPTRRQRAFLQSTRKGILRAARQALNPDEWIVRSRVNPLHVELALEIMRTAIGRAIESTISDSIMCGKPPVTLKRNTGERLEKRFQRAVADIFVPLGRRCITHLAALGFVPFLVHDSEDGVMRVPFIPDTADVEFRIIQHKASLYHKLVLYQHRGGYNLYACFYILEMPSVDGRLNSRAASLFEEYTCYKKRMLMSQTLDNEYMRPPLFLQHRDPNEKKAKDYQTEQGISSHSSVFAQANAIAAQRASMVVHSVAPIRPATDPPPGLIAAIEPSSDSMMPHTLIKLKDDLEVVKMDSRPALVDATVLHKTYLAAMSAAFGLPPALFTPDVAVYGRGFDAIRVNLVEVNSRWATIVQNALQVAYDSAYSEEDAQTTRAMIQSAREVTDKQRPLDEEMRRVADQRRMMHGIHARGTPDWVIPYAATGEDLAAVAWISEQDPEVAVEQLRVLVYVTYDTYVSMDTLHKLLELGTIDEDQAAVLALRALRIDTDLIAAEAEVRSSVRKNAADPLADTAVAQAAASKKGRKAAQSKARNKSSSGNMSAIAESIPGLVPAELTTAIV